MPSDRMHEKKKKLTPKQRRVLKLLAERLKKKTGVKNPFAVATVAVKRQDRRMSPKGRRRFKGV
jgi:hypothetical protein